MKLSIVCPCYEEEANLPKFYDTVLEETSKLGEGVSEVELLFVDDGSRDKTAEILRQMREKDARVKAIFFSRNFGKEAAMLAGLKAATGEAVVLIDADLQDPVELLCQMWQKFQNGAECVFARRVDRTGEGKIRAFLSEQFYKVNRTLCGVDVASGARDFRFMSRRYVDAVLSLSEYHRFSKNIFSWVGFRQECVEFHYQKREGGQSGWGLLKLFKYALDGIFSFSAAPLRFAFLVGFFSSLVGGVYGFYCLLNRVFNFDYPVSGWTSLVCLLMFFFGIVLLVLGVIGEYIARIYEQVKNRPMFITKE